MKTIMEVRKPEEYDGPFHNYRQPTTEIGHFSLDCNGKFCDDKHQLRYLVMPNRIKGLHMDLEEGYSKYIFPSRDSEYGYDILLRWITSHQEEIQTHFVDSSTSRASIDFVCFRGMMKNICSTIYQRSYGWSARVGKYKSTIYLASSDQPVTGGDQEREKVSEDLRRTYTWGYKFEQCMTSEKMNSKPDTSVPVNENERCYTVMRGMFGKYTLLFAGELDAVDPAHSSVDPTSVTRYVELKTLRRITDERQRKSFLRYKLLDWYLQSYLIGTPRLICGIRDEDKIVRELSIYKVSEMPRMAQGMWSSAACLNFGLQFLNFVKETAVKDCAETEYMYSWSPGRNIICEEIPVSEIGFPPKWYTNLDSNVI